MPYRVISNAHHASCSQFSFYQCCFPESLVAEFDTARPKISLPEQTRHGGCTWRAQLIAGVRAFFKPLKDSLKSERSRLSDSVIELFTVVLTGLGPAFDPLVSFFMPSLLELCAHENKVSANRAEACISTIIDHTRSPSILPHLAESAPRLCA